MKKKENTQRSQQQEKQKNVFDPTIPIGYVDETDKNFSIMLCLDPWEEHDEERILSDPRLWNKVNPHIGTIVQPDFYENEAVDARKNNDKRKEFLTKNMNIFQSEKVIDWKQPSDIYPLQRDARVDDFSSDDGWECFAGFDFSMGDDLYAVTWLLVNRLTGKFFADLDAWISDEATAHVPIRPLYDIWVQQGWLHKVPGKVFRSSLFIGRVIQIAEKLNIRTFGYDPFQSKQAVNDLSALLVSVGSDPKSSIIPVSQNFGTTNPLVNELDYLISCDDPTLTEDGPLITFSKNPLWPWEFGNCMIAISNDHMENKKIVKSGDYKKVDNIQCLMNALHCYDKYDAVSHSV
jgi:phage terminase large subunit-like protein